MKKVFYVVIAMCLTLFSFTPYIIKAEDEETTEPTTTEEIPQTVDEPAPTSAPSTDFSDVSYWTDLCTGSVPLSDNEKASCTAFMTQMSESSKDLKDRIAEIEAERSKIAEDISYYGQLVQGYQADADALNGEIATLNGEIAVKDKEIKEKEKKVDESQAEIDAAQEKIIERMVIAQETMRINKFLDILMGAKSFEDFIRIANGLSTITEYDEKVMADLGELIEKLNKEKAELQVAKDELAVKRQEVVDKQNEILAMKYQAQLVEEEYRLKAAELVDRKSTLLNSSHSV